MGDAEHQAIRDMFAAFNESGPEAMLDCVDPEAELITPAELASQPGTWKGHDGIRAYFESFFEAMEAITVHPEHFEDVGDWVVVDLRVSFKGRASGLEAEQVVPCRVAVRDGKVFRVMFAPTRDETIADARAGA